MILEAARQIYISVREDRPLHLSNITFAHDLPLGLLTGSDASVEIQLTTKKEVASEMYSFEIFSQSGLHDDEHGWRLHCSGKFHMRNSVTEQSDLAIRPSGASLCSVERRNMIRATTSSVTSGQTNRDLLVTFAKHHILMRSIQ